MLKVRASFIKQKLAAGIPVGYENFKVIPCVKLVKAKRNECPCIELPGCFFQKTVVPIIRHLYIKYVGTSQGELSYDYVAWNEFEEKLHHRYKDIAQAPYYTFKNIGDLHNHYLHNDSSKKWVTYELIPYDPIEYALFPDCNGKINNCLSAFDVEFTIDSDLESILFERTYTELVKPRPQDTDVFSNSMKDLKLPLK